MSQLEFRLLKPEEIEIRAQSVKANGVVLLLYKNARCDMGILDEMFTPLGWQREHKELKGNIYAGVSVWCENKGVWVTKWDAGAESKTEAVKGEASDSFKRACTNWGIGRELYTSPFIWISSNNVDIKQNGNRYVLGFKEKFHVERIMCDENKNIVAISIKNENGKRVFLHHNKKEVDRLNSKKEANK